MLKIRTEVETTDSGAVLDGNIDLFLKSYLMSNNKIIFFFLSLTTQKMILLPNMG